MSIAALRPNKRVNTVRRALALASLVPTCWLSTRAWSQPKVLRIGRTDYNSPLVDIEERVLNEALDRLGIACEFLRLPLLRLIEMANDGSVDADIGRIPEIAARFPNLVMVPTPICRSEVAVYGTAPDFDKRTRSEIMKMNVGIVRGVFILGKYSQGMKVIEVQNFEGITSMLANQRIEAALTIYLDTEMLVRSKQMPEMTRWPYLWAQEPLHFLLHRKHEALVPRLDAVLQQMARQGLIAQAYAERTQRLGIVPLRPASAAPQ